MFGNELLKTSYKKHQKETEIEKVMYFYYNIYFKKLNWKNDERFRKK